MNAMTQTRPQPGLCDNCGRWDGALTSGFGACCTGRLKTTSLPQPIKRDVSWCFNREQLNNALIQHHTAAAVACGLTKEQTQGCMQIVLAFLNSPEARKLRVESTPQEASREI